MKGATVYEVTPDYLRKFEKYKLNIGNSPATIAFKDMSLIKTVTTQWLIKIRNRKHLISRIHFLFLNIYNCFREY
jgi:hypothetical protein